MRVSSKFVYAVESGGSSALERAAGEWPILFDDGIDSSGIASPKMPGEVQTGSSQL